MSLDQLPINAFDVAFLAILIAGLTHGRKLGMSGELLGLMRWLAVLVGCSVAYEPVGRYLAATTPVLSLLTCYLVAYLATAAAIITLFALLNRALGGKLLGSDVFGHAEYYLGMGSGLIRFGCILLAALALLNARYFDPVEVRAMERFQNDMYGSDYFPTLHTVQSVVFEKSLAGRWIKENLGFFLIKPTAPEKKQFHQKEAVLP